MTYCLSRYNLVITIGSKHAYKFDTQSSHLTGNPSFVRQNHNVSCGPLHSTPIPNMRYVYFAVEQGDPHQLLAVNVPGLFVEVEFINDRLTHQCPQVPPRLHLQLLQVRIEHVAARIRKILCAESSALIDSQDWKQRTA